MKFKSVLKFGCKQLTYHKAVVVAQLAEWSLPTQEDPGSNSATINCITNTRFCLLYWKHKKLKESGTGLSKTHLVHQKHTGNAGSSLT